jgi:MFS family permease
VLLVVAAIGGLIGAVAALRTKPERPLLVACLVIVPNALPLILLALELPWETYLVGALISGFGNMLFNTLWETALQQHIPAASLSRVSAYDWFGSLLCQPIGLALAGIVAAGIGMSTTLWIAAAVDCVAVAAMLAAPSVRNLRRLDEPAVQQVTQQLVAD